MHVPALPHKAPVFHNADAKRVLPSRLVIPAIKVDTPVVELGWKTSKTASGSIFSEWDVAEYAAGWHKNSSVPGETGNVVMSGHNNILGSVFRELDQLKRGDTLEVFAGGTEYAYAVDEVLILPEKHASDAAAEGQRQVHPGDDRRPPHAGKLLAARRQHAPDRGDRQAGRPPPPAATN